MVESVNNPELTPEQNAELARLKQHFPFRIVFGVIRKDGTFEAWAKSDMRMANKLAREGHSVFVVQSGNPAKDYKIEAPFLGGQIGYDAAERAFPGQAFGEVFPDRALESILRRRRLPTEYWGVAKQSARETFDRIMAGKGNPERQPRYYVAEDDWPLRSSRTWWSVYDSHTGNKMNLRPGAVGWRFGSQAMAQRAADKLNREAEREGNPSDYHYRGPAIDYSLLSPSGHMSKRARKAAMERETKRLFAGVDLTPMPPTLAQRVERIRQRARELRGLAERGMHPRKYVAEADKLESQAAELEREGNPLGFTEAVAAGAAAGMAQAATQKALSNPRRPKHVDWIGVFNSRFQDRRNIYYSPGTNRWIVQGWNEEGRPFLIRDWGEHDRRAVEEWARYEVESVGKSGNPAPGALMTRHVYAVTRRAVA